MVFSRLIFPGVLLLSQALGQADEQLEFFESRVRPVLSTHCFECHGHKTKGGLKLDSREAILTGGDSGAAVVPGKPKDAYQARLDDAITKKMQNRLPGFYFVLREVYHILVEGAPEERRAELREQGLPRGAALDDGLGSAAQATLDLFRFLVRPTY